MKNHYKRKEIIKLLVVMGVIGLVSLVSGKIGAGHISELIRFVEQGGNTAPLIFVLCNTLGLVLVVPQTLFTVASGLLFGTFKGAALSLISIAFGSSISFFTGKFLLRKTILKKFRHTYYFKKLEKLSADHPLKILALSRIVPILPYPVVNYLWSVTAVNYFAYIIMSLICIIPETMFLTAGGHLLQSGFVRGTLDWPIILILLLAGSVVLILIRKLSKVLE